MIIEKFEKFTTRLGIYNGLIFQTKVHFIKTLRKEKEISENTQYDKPRPLLGSNFVYKNPLTGINEFKHRHFVTIDNLEENIGYIQQHYFNFLIAQSFEAFESMLKDLITAYLISHPEKLIHIKDKEEINLENFDKCRETIRIISSRNNQNNKRIFKIIYELNQKIKHNEKQNLLRFNFNEWNVVLTKIRHSIVHSNSFLKKSDTLNWSPFQLEILSKWFSNDIHSENIKINTVNEYQIIIQHIAKHGQIIFDGLNE